jgi:hypothetical protein
MANQIENQQPSAAENELLCSKTLMHPSEVRRHGNVIVKDAHPWTTTVHSLLNHLERIGFDASPTIVGSGFNSEGQETITYIHGTCMTEGQWSLQGAIAVGQMLRRVHEATCSYRPPAEACWRPWFGRLIGGPKRIISHCDVAPWNIIAQGGLPIALIDWDFAGPVDPMIDLAQACWLNAKLHDEIVAKREGLSSPEDRAILLRAIVEGYGLSHRQRLGLVELMIEFAMHSVASEADEANILPETPSSALDRELTWAMAWRARAAVWMSKYKRILQDALA